MVSGNPSIAFASLRLDLAKHSAAKSVVPSALITHSLGNFGTALSVLKW